MSVEDLTLDLLERVRLVLCGASVIDWFRLGFRDPVDVREFLQVNGFDLDDPVDVLRVRSLLAMAADYLERALQIHVDRELWAPRFIEDSFLAASRLDHPQQREACILLKLVHTINHYEARELRLNLALSEVQVFGLVEGQVARGIRAMISDGYPIELFQGSRKSRESTITKLLSKRRATAAEILDHLRFRIVVRELDDIPVVIAAMTQRLIAFNYIVPEETTNDVLDFGEYIRRHPHLRVLQPELQWGASLERQDRLRRAQNECSSADFRMLNFVVDLPVRIDGAVNLSDYSHLGHLGRLVFLNVEFQVFDKRTWDANEANAAASHSAYKERQRERVRQRLIHGISHDSDD